MYMPHKIWNPEDYDKQSVLQFRTAMNMLDTLPLQGNEKILDIGCGTGKISHQIATQRVPHGSLTGVDINEQMITYAKNNYAAANLVFECNNVLSITHEDFFDVAVSFWTLSWIPMADQLHALNNIIQSLNEHGKLFLMYPLRHDAYDVVDMVIKKPEWQEYFSEYSLPRPFITEEQYTDEILAYIPMDINVAKKEIECRYTDDEEMMASINCWLSHVDEIPQDKKHQFLLDVANSYKQHRGISEPIMYYSTLEITGEKYTLRNTLTP